MNKMWDQYPEIKKELELIKEELHTVNKTSERYLDESIDYMLSTGGKMLRPAFVLIGASFSKNDEQEKIRNVATAIETLHMATLIHDDIIDDSSMRRGKPSIQSKYSKEYAVYMGDYLLTQVFMMLAKHDYKRENLYDIARGVSKLCIGEMLQYQLRYKTDVSTRDYLKVISGKTAGLFAISLGIGAHIGGADEKLCKTLGRIGYNIGMAFQIKDDQLDYAGDADVVGKDLLADLANGYFTLPVIYAIRNNDHENLKEMLMKPESINDVIKIIKNSSGLKDAKKLADKYTARALKHIESLPEGDGKEILKALVPKLLKREL